MEWAALPSRSSTVSGWGEIETEFPVATGKQMRVAGCGWEGVTVDIHLFGKLPLLTGEKETTPFDRYNVNSRTRLVVYPQVT